MNVLIIGGNGFIGSHIIDIFLFNNCKVRVYDHSEESYRKPIKNVDYWLNTVKNLDALDKSMKGIDIIIHLASSSVPSTSNLDFISDISNNLLDSINIFKSAVNNKVKKIVYFSSGGAIYSPQKRPIKEEDLQNPISSYGIIKTTTEKYLELFKKMYHIETLIIRPSNPYGPRQGNYNKQGVISTFIKKSILGEPLTIFGDGESAKDYIFVEDLAKIVYKLINNNINGTFNVGSGIATSLNSIIEIIGNISEFKSEIRYVNQNEFDIPNFVLNIDKLNTCLNEEICFTGIVDGINNTWKWIAQNNSNK